MKKGDQSRGKPVQPKEGYRKEIGRIERKGWVEKEDRGVIKVSDTIEPPPPRKKSK